MEKEIKIGMVIISGACLLVGAFILDNMDAKTRSESGKIFDRLTNEKYGEESERLATVVETASKAANDIYAAENAKTKAEVSMNEAYIKARSNADVLRAEIDILKQNARNIKSDTTQVAAGTGDSAVSVRIENNSKLLELKSQITAKEFEYKYNDKLANELYSAEAFRIRSNRSADDQKILDDYEKARHEFQKLSIRKENYRNELKADNDTCLRVGREVMKNTFSLPKIIFAHALMATLPITFLALLGASFKRYLDMYKWSRQNG